MEIEIEGDSVEILFKKEMDITNSIGIGLHRRSLVCRETDGRLTMSVDYNDPYNFFNLNRQCI